MKIIKLEAENFKRLKAVSIDADGTLQVVGGRNAQGKSSVLDAIWWVLQQRAAGVDRPVRDGEHAATVTLTFEDFIVTRTTSGGKGGGKLQITGRDGGVTYNSPQKMLDELVGKLSLDPLAFALAEPKKQVEILQGLVDLGFDPAEVERQRKAIYEERTEIGRAQKAAKGVVDSLPEPPADTPEFEVSAAELADEIRAAEDVEREYVAAGERYYEVEAEIARLRGELGRLQDQLSALTARGLDLGRQRRPDLAQLQQQLREVDEVNQRVRLRQQREHAVFEYEEKTRFYGEQTMRLEKLEAWRKEKLAAAPMPVPGLGFDEEGVTYNGVPLSQASGAERLRVSTGIAMALNPQVRVIRITDGSLMDDDSMKLIAEMAAEQDFQLWVERVGSADGIGVIIEDGEVA